jgi:type II secretory pathway pseudopilin PulG
MKPSNTKAFTMLELLVVLLLVIVLVGALIPSLSHRKKKAIRIQCINNLKQVGLGFRIFEQDHGKYPMQFRTNDFDGPAYASDKLMFRYFQSLSNELSNPKYLTCPQDRQRHAAINFDADLDSSHVSYFIGLNAKGDKPTSLLAGDRNLVAETQPAKGVLEITPNQAADSSSPAISWSNEIHTNVGHVLFADSHVDRLNSPKLREALRDTTLTTNRLVFP